MKWKAEEEEDFVEVDVVLEEKEENVGDEKDEEFDVVKVENLFEISFDWEAAEKEDFGEGATSILSHLTSSISSVVFWLLFEYLNNENISVEFLMIFEM